MHQNRVATVLCPDPLAVWYLTGGRVLVTGLRDPPHWSWFKRPWVGHIWSPLLEYVTGCRGRYYFTAIIAWHSMRYSCSFCFTQKKTCHWRPVWWSMAS